MQNAACLRALTLSEVADFRAIGCKGPIAVIPNGISVPDDADAEQFLNFYPHLRGKNIIIFLGRIDRKKGLDILCRAWKGLVARHTDAHLVIAGPDRDGTGEDVKSFLREHALSNSCTLTGYLT